MVSSWGSISPLDCPNPRPPLASPAFLTSVVVHDRTGHGPGRRFSVPPSRRKGATPTGMLTCGRQGRSLRLPRPRQSYYARIHSPAGRRPQAASRPRWWRATPAVRDLAGWTGLARVAQPLGDAIERRREASAHRRQLLTAEAPGAAGTLTLQQRDLKQRERIDVRISETDRRLEHGIVSHLILALPDAQQHGDRAAELILQLIEQREVAAQLTRIHSGNGEVGLGRSEE